MLLWVSKLFGPIKNQNNQNTWLIKFRTRLPGWVFQVVDIANPSHFLAPRLAGYASWSSGVHSLRNRVTKAPGLPACSVPGSRCDRAGSGVPQGLHTMIQTPWRRPDGGNWWGDFWSLVDDEYKTNIYIRYSAEWRPENFGEWTLWSPCDNLPSPHIALGLSNMQEPHSPNSSSYWSQVHSRNSTRGSHGLPVE